MTRRRVQAEGDVRQAENDLAFRHRPGDPLDCLQGVEAEPAVVRVAGADRKGQRIEEEIRRRQPVLAAGEVVEPPRHGELVLDLLGHAGLVDRQCDDRGAEAACEAQTLVGRLLTVLEIDRVDDRLAAVELECRLEHRILGRVDDERRVDRTTQAGHRLGHVGDLVASDKGGAKVEGVRALLDLLAAHLDAPVPVALLLQSAELARAVGVAALADRQISVFLAKRDLAIERGDSGGPHRATVARQGPGTIPADAAQHRVECRDVPGLGAAAPADHVDPVLDHKAFEPLRQFGGPEGEMGTPVDELGKPGIGLDRDIPGPVLAEPFDVLGHLARARRAVEPDHRHIERPDDRRRGGDIGADEQASGRLDRHLDEDRRVLMCILARSLGAIDRGLDLQRVLAGLDQDRIGAPGDQSGALNGERVLERLIGDMAE